MINVYDFNECYADKLGSGYPLQRRVYRGQSYKTFYTLGRCEIKCLNCRFNEKEKCNPINMLGSSVLTL